MSAALVVAEWEALVVIQEVPEGSQAVSVLHSAIRRGLEAAGLGCRVWEVRVYVRRPLWLKGSCRLRSALVEQCVRTGDLDLFQMCAAPGPGLAASGAARNYSEDF